MIGLLLVAMLGFVLYRLLGGAPRLQVRRHQPEQVSVAKIKELTDYAARLRAGNKYTSAEKVYLQILKIDHKHATTYSRLGTLYSAQKNYADAIECFHIATQLSPSGATFYNLGLAYYENRNLMKAVAAFEKGIMFEPSLQRYVALAKAFQKLGDGERMIAALEQASELEPSVKVLWLLADAYGAVGKVAEQQATHERVKALAPRDPRLKELKKQQKLAA